MYLSVSASATFGPVVETRLSHFDLLMESGPSHFGLAAEIRISFFGFVVQTALMSVLLKAN